MIASISIHPGDAPMVAGKTQLFTATATDIKGNVLPGKAFVWTSSDTTVLKVNSTLGQVTGVVAGRATITATTEGKSGTADVVVGEIEGAVFYVDAPGELLPISIQITRGASGKIATPIQGKAPRCAIGDTPGEFATKLAPGKHVVSWTGGGLIPARQVVEVKTGECTRVRILPVAATVEIEGAGDGTGAVVRFSDNHPICKITAGQVSSTGCSVQGAHPFAYNLKAVAEPGSEFVRWHKQYIKTDGRGASSWVTGNSIFLYVNGPTETGVIATAEFRKTTTSEVASVSISPNVASVVTGGTQHLSATAKDAAGQALSGKTFTWRSNNTGVATVDTTGLVKGIAAGSATITATSEGKSGTATVTVTAAPVSVASVTVSPSTASIQVGATQQLSATPKDAAGKALSGRTVTWTSTNSSVATVDAAGLVKGIAAGSATITATSEGKSGTAAITVTAPPPASATRVSISPAFISLDVGTSKALQATAYDAAGNTLSSPRIAWSSSSTGVAGVSSSGSVSGAAPGVAKITAQVDQTKGEAAVAVLGPKSLLSTAFVGTGYLAEAKPGQTITVPITLDLSKVSPSGDLGSVQLELAYDPAVLEFVAHASTLSGNPLGELKKPGTFHFSFAGTAPHGKSSLTLTTLTFRVAAGASAGTERELKLTHLDKPLSTTLSSYELPVALGGKLRIIK